MEPVLARLLQPSGLFVGLVLVVFALIALVLLWAGGTSEPGHLVAPFRWLAAKNLA